MTAAGTLATLAAFVWMLQPRQPHQSSLTLRVAVSLAIIIGALLWGWSESRKAVPSSQPTPPGRVTVTATHTVPPPPPPKPKPRPTLVVVDEHGVLQADLMAVLRAAAPKASAVSGRLRTSVSAPDPEQAGMITANMTLSVVMKDEAGGITNAFDLSSRGGDFDADAAAAQARRRLHQSLRGKLHGPKEEQ